MRFNNNHILKVMSQKIVQILENGGGGRLSVSYLEGRWWSFFE